MRILRIIYCGEGEQGFVFKGIGERFVIWINEYAYALNDVQYVENYEIHYSVSIAVITMESNEKLRIVERYRSTRSKSFLNENFF